MFLLQTWVMTVVVTTPTIVEVEVEVDTLGDLEATKVVTRVTKEATGVTKVDTRETKEAIIEEAIRATKQGLYLACLLYFI
jgi:hypothetical protein